MAGKVIVRGVACTAKGCGAKFSSMRGGLRHFDATGHKQYRNVDVIRTRVNPETYAKRPAKR